MTPPRSRRHRFFSSATALALLTSLIAAAGPTVTASADPNWVQLENAMPGTTAWHITPGAPRRIAGYASRTSEKVGNSIDLYVDTKDPSYHIEAYRLGYYGGLGGRLVWTSDAIAGIDQPRRTLTRRINMVEARWSSPVSVALTSDFVEGSYLFKLVTSAGGEAYIPFVVRNDSSHSPLLLQHQVTTWQAYNRWGKYSLYKGRDGSFAKRSRVASFDRPYGGRGMGGMLTSYPFIALVEKAGLDVSYWTDIDLQQRPNLLANHAALISLDHDEYWSREMVDGAIAARDAGLNIAFLGANAIFRKVRFESSPLGPAHRMVNYKIGSEDPLYGIDDPAVTSNWRSDPVNEPESRLLGAMYECNPVHADMVVADGSNWVYAGTGLTTGAHIPMGVDMEYDSIHRPAPTPRSVQILAASPLTCGRKSDVSHMTYYTTSSDAGVLDVASQGWVKLLGCGAPVSSPTCDPRAETITLNILNAFAAGPAGLVNPSVSNLASFGIVLKDPLDP